MKKQRAPKIDLKMKRVPGRQWNPMQCNNAVAVQRGGKRVSE